MSPVDDGGGTIPGWIAAIASLGSGVVGAVAVAWRLGGRLAVIETRQTAFDRDMTAIRATVDTDHDLLVAINTRQEAMQKTLEHIARRLDAVHSS